jgi:NADPH2:quinone reductase
MSAWTRAVLMAPREFGFQESALPEPGPGEVRVRVRGCGICGSDVPVWNGFPWAQYPYEPGAPGHEICGYAEAGDLAATGLMSGQYVTGLATGGYAGHVLMRATEILPVPPALADRLAIAEPMGCAVNVVERAAISAEDRVVVLGLGFMGSLITQLVRRRGPRALIAVARHESSRALAEAAGAMAFVALESREPVGAVWDLLGDPMASVVIECTGKQETLDIATNLTGTRGRLVIAGYHADGSRTVNMQLWNWKGIDVINAHERDPQVYLAGMRQALDLWAAGAIDPGPLLTHTVPLAAINDGFRLAADRAPGVVKVVVTP